MKIDFKHNEPVCAYRLSYIAVYNNFKRRCKQKAMANSDQYSINT